jgi:CRP-like cAMP-binding protein
MPRDPGDGAGRAKPANVIMLISARAQIGKQVCPGANAAHRDPREHNADTIEAPRSTCSKPVTTSGVSRMPAPPSLAVVTYLTDLRPGTCPVPDHAGVGVRKQCGKREALFRQGDAATHLFRIIDGAVALERFLEDGRRQLVELLLPGDYCGLAVDGHYTATGVALSPTTFQACPLAELERHDDLGWDIMHQFEAQICTAHEHLLAVGRMTALERVASLLLRLSRLDARATGRSAQRLPAIAIHIPLTRGEMGDYLGLSLETVCRVMSDLERRGLITICRRHGDVLINDPQRLRRLIG